MTIDLDSIVSGNVLELLLKGQTDERKYINLSTMKVEQKTELRDCTFYFSGENVWIFMKKSTLPAKFLQHFSTNS